MEKSFATIKHTLAFLRIQMHMTSKPFALPIPMFSLSYESKEP